MADTSSEGYVVLRRPVEAIQRYMIMLQLGGPSGRARAISVPILPAPLGAVPSGHEKNRGSAKRKIHNVQSPHHRK